MFYLLHCLFLPTHFPLGLQGSSFCWTTICRSMAGIALNSIPMLPLPHASSKFLFIFICIFRNMNILLERRKGSYCFHQNILDCVPEKISILSSYTSWTPLIKILPIVENNVHTSTPAQIRLRMLAGSALSSLAHVIPPLSLGTISPVTRTCQYWNALQLNPAC